jgi:hypothetical protein
MSDQLLHIVFFTLKDKSAEKQSELVAACEKYLQPQPGVVFFSSGTRDTELQREVNDTEFEVSLVLLFEDAEAQARYQEDPTHHQFIEEQKDNWENVRVFDSKA